MEHLAELLVPEWKMEGKETPSKGKRDDISIKQGIINHFKNHQIKVGPQFREAVDGLVSNILADSIKSHDFDIADT